MDKAQKIMILIICSIVVVVCLASYTIKASTIKTFEGEVEKTIIQNGETYFVIRNLLSNVSEVFQNNDAPLFGKVNSADFLMNIEVGEIYMFKVVGVRIQFLSLYKNLLDYE